MGFITYNAVGGLLFVKVKLFIIYLLCGGKYELLFIVKFSLVEYYVHEIFDG